MEYLKKHVCENNYKGTAAALSKVLDFNRGNFHSNYEFNFNIVKILNRQSLSLYEIQFSIVHTRMYFVL